MVSDLNNTTQLEKVAWELEELLKKNTEIPTVRELLRHKNLRKYIFYAKTNQINNVYNAENDLYLGYYLFETNLQDYSDVCEKLCQFSSLIRKQRKPQ